MLRSHQFAKSVPASNVKFRPSGDTMKTVTQKPMFTKMVQIVLTSPGLRNADASAYRKYMVDHAPFVDVPEAVKCNRKSAEVRQVGNRFYLEKNFDEALKKYNESICYAEAGSEHLGTGYANRSAIYYEQGEYEFALANIDMAKKNNYPEKLMPKLLAREMNCKQKINNGESKGTVPCPRMGINVEVNPKIPFLAKGIKMEILKEFGRGLVAEKDFRAGDVILSEKPVAAAIDSSLRYADCSYCSIVHFNSLIPCPGCVSFMYCNEECREADWKTHRFECGVAEKLMFVSYGNLFLGPRMFFYGLSLFNDDLNAMMEFCEANRRTGGNPLELDYTNYDPLEEFKVFHQTKAPKNTSIENVFNYFSAGYFSVFIEHPPVKAIVKTKREKDFMLQTILDYMRTASYLAFDKWECYASPLGLIATVCNHSCDPNAYAAIHAGEIKLAVLRPIKKGEQICISYGPVWYEQNELKMVETMTLGFECRCVVCDPAKTKSWRASGQKLPPDALPHWGTIELLMMMPPGVNEAAVLNAIQQYVDRYAYVHPRDQFNLALEAYRKELLFVIMQELLALQRAKAVEGLL